MSCSTAPAFALFLSLTALGCAHHITEVEAGGSADTTHGPAAGPAWLGDSSWAASYEEGGELVYETWVLEPDGSGTWKETRTVEGLDYDTATMTEGSPITWSSDGRTLVLEGSSYPLQVTPNCRLLQIGPRMFSGGPNDSSNPCPFDMPALSATESALIGSWTFVDPESSGDSSSGSDAILTLAADRYATFHYTMPSSWTEDIDDATVDQSVYFVIDAKNVLHGTDADGHDVLDLALTPRNGSLGACWETSYCFTLTPSKD